MQIVKPNILLPGNISLILVSPGSFKGGSVERQCILLNKACVMKVGDLVRVPQAKCNGIIIEIDDTHRQTNITVLTEHGYLLEKIWEAHVQII